nr:MAG TPA: hypothetical protein [Caudoviricetes sp.]
MHIQYTQNHASSSRSVMEREEEYDVIFFFVFLN